MYDATRGRRCALRAPPRPMDCLASASEAAALRTRPNVTANVVFFKLHKVGGTTFASSLSHALRAAGHLIAERGAQPLATACLDHQGGRDSGKVLSVLATFRRSELLQASPHARACMLNRHPSAVSHGACKLAVSLPTYAIIVLRQPVERIISKYYFQRHTCPGWQSRKKLRANAECAAIVLPLLAWLNLSATWVARPNRETAWRRLRLPGSPESDIPCEQLRRLGGGCTPHALAAAKATVSAMDVVGVTEHMGASLALAERVLGLPAGSAKPSRHLLVNANKPSVPAAVRNEIMRHPSVQLEAALYSYASQRFARLLARAGLAGLRSS